MIAELKEFLTRGNVLDLAVAVVIGAAFTAIVTALVDGIITPLIAAVVGQPDLSALTIPLRNDAALLIGSFIQAIINFVLVGTVLFFFIKAVKSMEKKQEAEPDPEPEAESDEVILLREIRDAIAAGRMPPPQSPAV